MRRNVAGLIGLLVAVTGLAQESKQPLGSYWFPNELLSWSPKTDEAAAFNVSTVPLAERFIEPGEPLDYDKGVPGITGLYATHPTSNHPAQGFPMVEQYAFAYWAYLDYFVQWGGSAAEGLIIAPVPTWTDAAHRNGVQVLGTVFFPPNVYGGKEAWVRDFLQQDEQRGFPIADKLIEVAAHYGFEGWFINQETHGMGVEDAEAMQQFLSYFQSKANGSCQIMWYDAMLDDGRVIWQEELNEHNEDFFQVGEERLSDIMFLDFGWHAVNLEDTRKRALELGRSPWELYAGIDVQSRGYKSFARWDDLYDEEGQLKNTSIALYWATSSFDLAESKQPEEVYAIDQKFWNGTDIDNPPHPRLKRWEGFTSHVPPRSTISDLPFVTRFNAGLGRFYNVDGERVSDSAWHNMSNQELLPHWQWDTDTLQVRATLSFDAAYNGGSCLQFDVQPELTQQTIQLFKTNLRVTASTELSVVTKGDAGGAKLQVSISSGEAITMDIEPSGDWMRQVLPLPKEKVGAIVTEISLVFESDGGGPQQLLVGELAIKDGASKPNRLAVDLQFFPESAEAFVRLEDIPEDVWYYDIYQVHGRTKRHVKRFRSAAIYVDRLAKENGSWGNLEVVPVSVEGIEGRGSVRRLK
ncbi:MAG: hypothetical protein AAGA85_02340 [Bacteroidota bacterium]